MKSTTTRKEAHEMTRENWLNQVATHLRHYIHESTGETVPEISISIGWPGGRGDKSSTIGQCWNAKVAADGKAAIFISPVLADPIRVVDVLAHEMVHALHPNAGHRGDFVKTAKAIGLVKPWTATTASDEFKAVAARIVMMAGEFAHGKINTGTVLTKTDPKTGKAVPTTPWGTPKQGTRMLKVVCPDDGYTVRTTAKWLGFGYPSCPCGTEMVDG
jgi:hypothetical protein